jgi:hypothetical protein
MVLSVKFDSHIASITENAIADTSLGDRLTGWRRYALLDRGSYEYVDVDPALCPPLGYAITEARAYRLSPGDYIFAHHDRVHDDLPLELTLDLSPAPVPAEVHYRRRGAVFFRVPCVPRSLAIVERGPAVTRNHTYVSKLSSGVVIRLVMLAANFA